jgi:hypothetical protein
MMMMNVIVKFSGLAASFLRGRSSMVEPQPSKLMMWVRSPSPAPSYEAHTDAHIAQQVEHFHGKEEVTGSIPVVGSVNFQYQFKF